MSRKRILLFAVCLVAFGVVYYLYGGHSTPKGQPPLVGLSCTSEDCIQRFSILYPRRCNAFTHLSRLLAGGLCNGTIAAGDQEPRRAGFRDLGAGIGDRFCRPFDRCTPARSRCASGAVLGQKTSAVSLAGRTQSLKRSVGLHRGICAPKAMARRSAEADLF